MIKVADAFHDFKCSIGKVQKLLAAKRKSVRAESEYELNGKLVRFALSRGFEMKDICRCIEVSEENDYSE